jgi:hypothetical protein
VARGPAGTDRSSDVTAAGRRQERASPDSLPTVPTTVTGKNVWLNEVRPWQWLEMGATLLAFFAWVTAVLALGADRPLAGILLGLVPGVLLVHVASWLLPTVLGDRVSDELLPLSWPGASVDGWRLPAWPSARRSWSSWAHLGLPHRWRVVRRPGGTTTRLHAPASAFSIRTPVSWAMLPLSWVWKRDALPALSPRLRRRRQ